MGKSPGPSYRFYRWGSTAPARTRGSRTRAQRSPTPHSEPRCLARSGTTRRGKAGRGGWGGGGEGEERRE